MRERKPEEDWHKFRGVEGNREITFIGGGASSYLRIEATEGDNPVPVIVTFQGQVALRRLARAILRNTKAAKR